MSLPTQDYGYTAHLFAAQKPNSDSIVIGGFSEFRLRWTRVLTPRAAQMLWFRLAQGLYPESSSTLIARVSTAPMRSPLLPTITSQVQVDSLESGDFEVSARSGAQDWTFRLNPLEAGKFWHQLDRVLYPVADSQAL